MEGVHFGGWPAGWAIQVKSEKIALAIHQHGWQARSSPGSAGGEFWFTGGYEWRWRSRGSRDKTQSSTVVLAGSGNARKSQSFGHKSFQRPRRLVQRGSAGSVGEAMEAPWMLFPAGGGRTRTYVARGY